MLRKPLHLVRPTLSYREGSEKGQKMHGHQTGAQDASLPLIGHVTLDKALSLSKSWFLPLQNEDHNCL